MGLPEANALCAATVSLKVQADLVLVKCPALQVKIVDKEVQSILCPLRA